MQLTARLAGIDGEHIVVSITAPEGDPSERRSVVLALDHSQSMTGERLARAKHAAIAFVGRLAEHEAFAIVAYAGTARTIAPLARATADARRAAVDAIESLAVGDGTCVSCGLDEAARALALPAPELGGDPGLIVLVSDGYPSLGLRGDELVAHAARVSDGGVSISTIGLGGGINERTLRGIAEAGRGRYTSLAQLAQLAQLAPVLAGELHELRRAYATGVELAVTMPVQQLRAPDAPDAPPGPAKPELAAVLGYPVGYGSPHPLPASSAVIRIGAMAPGDTRKVVLRIAGAPPLGAEGDLDSQMIARLAWRRAADGAERSALAPVRRAAAEDAAALGAAVEASIAGAVLERAADLLDARGAAGIAEARRLVEDRAEAVAVNPAIPATMREAIGARLAEAAESLRAADTTRDVPTAELALGALARWLTH